MKPLLASIAIAAQIVNEQHERNVGFNFNGGNRLELLAKVENVALQIMQCVSEDCMPEFNVPYGNDAVRIVSYGRDASRGKFSVVVYLLSKIHRLLTYDKRITKRELYYENVLKFKSQTVIDRSLIDICNLLQAPIWQLRVLGTAKGLIAGPVTFHIDGQVLTVDCQSGTLIPQNVIDITNISSPAKWILLIEKDAAFQKLIQDGGLKRLGPVIFITGKGFPDVNTRMLVRRLWETLGIPVLALVDADPYGIDIMCVYRFGSQTMLYSSPELACPAVRWLGVHPSDIKRLAIEKQAMTPKDIAKLKTIRSRPYISQNSQLLQEIETLLETGVKAEMEAVSKFSSCYLTDTYIPSKILCQEYL